MLILNSGLAQKIYPQYIRGVVEANPQIATMSVPESPIFDGIEPLEMRYFNHDERQIPTVCSGAFQVNRDNRVIPLALSEKIHGYLQGDINARSRALDKLRGFPIVEIKDKGTAILSTLSLEKGTTDPIAGKLFFNIMNTLLK